jgi:hypothetical protein
MLSSNQANIARNYPDLNLERDNVKERFIQHGIEEEKARSQQWWEAEQRLDGQLQEKSFKQAQESESRVKQQ